MTVGELIAELSQIDDLNKVVLLDGDGAFCHGINQEAEDNDEECVYINFNWKVPDNG